VEKLGKTTFGKSWAKQLLGKVGQKQLLGKVGQKALRLEACDKRTTRRATIQEKNICIYFFLFFISFAVQKLSKTTFGKSWAKSVAFPPANKNILYKIHPIILSSRETITFLRLNCKYKTNLTISPC